ncbi:Hpt domain-containing protein [Vibrio mytili]|uniref:Histidine phosphotransferase n=1 Tax=Vibrio mytili TaxID=50718 RepID=A0A0C3IC51_9VIBR|nr:hypothetical protein [Vibrio mytili]KIN11912.1 histidine phosphotransferase [Vibrio mytili]
MINFTVLSEYMDNDVDKLISVLSTYLENHGDGSERIARLNSEQNWPELHILVRELKNELESFGEDTAVVALQGIENHARNNIEPDNKDIKIVSRELLTINQQIFAYLDNQA